MVVESSPLVTEKDDLDQIPGGGKKVLQGVLPIHGGWWERFGDGGTNESRKETKDGRMVALEDSLLRLSGTDGL
ncbi:hypothetical protein HPP92_023958 [Vanilla planifolia]|uniref:Uncharacterized protein n=1 Tax=Vanilla planifolia TaxID=51239 RepID=A0A835PM03_VANPL|nr:hypothetical protein HPP92_023958 [Vanilla planifolia]